VTRGEFTSLRLRDSAEPAAAIDEIVAILLDVGRQLKVQIDLKELEPLSDRIVRLLLDAIAPLRARPNLRVVVGCLGDWNLRALRRLDPSLLVGLDFMCYLDAPVDEFVRLPMRLNAYGYLDDHPLGYRRFLDPPAYLQDRMETLLELVSGAVEFYVRKDFLLQALADGFDPVGFIHKHKPGALVDVWTFYASEPDLDRKLFTALDAGADQVSSPTSALLAEFVERSDLRGP
jgi:glycerophosphoryl diester phosphodiesterase